MSSEKFPIVFEGQGLKDLDDMAKQYGISRGEIVVKALKLLKITQTKGGGTVMVKEDKREINIDTNKL